MKISRNWLNDLIDISDLKTEEITGLLTFSGIEVENVEISGVSSELIIVARISTSDPHPDADRLSVCQVDDGSGTPRQIVCGAKNYTPGDCVPLALPGATVGAFEIKEGRLRGVASLGMLCSARELGLGNENEGLLILQDNPQPGTLIRELFKSDTIFELEITPNRPDCLSHLGVARELSALTGRPLRLKGSIASEGGGKSLSTSSDEIALSAPDDCPFYTARKITGVEVKESPQWLQDKLTSIGLRPINNVVDVTNYLLMERGHPLHAFDVAKLDGGIDVRRAAEDEVLATLDEEEHILTSDDLVISDCSKALAIAGVMGGIESGVTASTTDILLESAYFLPSRIRQTSRRLGLSSDSSYRFERGADPSQVLESSELAVALIVQLAGGTADEVIRAVGAAPEKTTAIPFDADFCRKILGAEIEDDEIAAILSQLGLEQSDQGETTSWIIPSYRLDLKRPIDLVEEVARIYGLDKIPSRNLGPTAEISKADIAYDARMRLRRHLAAQGFHECTTLKLISTTQTHDELGLGMRRGETVALKNPLSEDHTHMRSSIVPGLLASMRRNLRMGATEIRLFELGTCFLNEAKHPTHTEIQQLAIAITGHAAPESWLNKHPDEATFHDLRGSLEALLPGCSIAFTRVKHAHFPLAAQIKVNGKSAGLAAQVGPSRSRELGVDGAILIAEIDLACLQKQSSVAFKVSDLPRFPAITRDVAIETAADLPAGDIDSFFAQQKEPLLVEASLFDVFMDPTGEKLPTDRRSVAYKLIYRDSEATLKAEQVDKAHTRILEALQAKLSVTIR